MKSLNLKLFFKLLIPFALAQYLAIFVAQRVLVLQGATSIIAPAFDITAQNTLQPILGDVLIWLIFSVVFIVLTLRFRRFFIYIYPFVLTLILISGAQIVGFAISPALGMAFAILIPIIFWLSRSILTHTVIMVVTIAGIGALFGLSLAPMTAVVLLAIFSVYDIVAVYQTGHMVALAKVMIESSNIFGFVIPFSWRDFVAPITQVRPGGRFVVLGSGDVLFPMLLSVSLVRTSVLQAGIVAGCACLGLFLMHVMFQNQKTHRPLAALPPISVITIVGYLIVAVLN